MGASTVNAFVAVTLGAFIGLGALILIQGLRGRKILPTVDEVLPAGVTRDAAAVALTLGLVVGVAVFVITGWPVAAVACGGLVLFLPKLLGGRKQQKLNIDRTQAIASWAEMIRDNMAGAAGLEQALLATVVVAPAPIALEIQRFAARLERMNLVEALAALGEDLDHPSADLIVVSLANAARMEARELGPLLSRLADSIRDNVRMRLRVEVGRARIRTSARVVVGTTILTIIFLFVFSRDLLEPYDTATGQLWMCFVVAVFVAGGWLMKIYGRVEMPARFSARPQQFTRGATTP